MQSKKCHNNLNPKKQSPNLGVKQARIGRLCITSERKLVDYQVKL